MQEVTQENLISGNEYYLECYTHDERRKMVLIDTQYKMIARFDKLETNIFDYVMPCFSNFRKIRDKNKNTGYNVTLNNYWKYYEICKERIQTDMENRSVNQIIQNLIRDEYFRIDFL